MINKAWSSEGFCLNVNYNHWSASFHSCHHLWPLIQNYASLIFKSRDDWLKGLHEEDEVVVWIWAFSAVTKDSCSCVDLFWHLDQIVFFFWWDRFSRLHCVIMSQCHTFVCIAHKHTKKKGGMRRCVGSMATWAEMWHRQGWKDKRTGMMKETQAGIYCFQSHSQKKRKINMNGFPRNH